MSLIQYAFPTPNPNRSSLTTEAPQQRRPSHLAPNRIPFEAGARILCQMRATLQPEQPSLAEQKDQELLSGRRQKSRQQAAQLQHAQVRAPRQRLQLAGQDQRDAGAELDRHGAQPVQELGGHFGGAGGAEQGGL